MGENVMTQLFLNQIDATEESLSQQIELQKNPITATGMT